MSTKGNEAVKAFRKKYGVLKPDLSKLKEIISSQGYSIIEYNAIADDENVATVIRELGLEDMVASSKGFTYADSNNRLIFVHEDLSEDEKLSVLSHEQGHIFCGHIEEKNYIGRDVQQENEASEFAYRLLNPDFKEKFFSFLKRKKILICVTASVLAIGIFVLCFVLSESDKYGEFYVTQSGGKYHKSECIYVKNKNNTKRLTKEEFESGEYEPCGVCLPQDE